MANLVRAAAIAAVSSAVGYAVVAYRKRRSRQQIDLDKRAVQEWETDGGNNLRPPPCRDASSEPRLRAELLTPPV